MTKEELQKELELLADSCDSNYALEVNGYSRGVLDALDVVNKYFALAPVSSTLKCSSCGTSWEEQQRLNDAIEQTKCTYDRKCEFKENGKCSIPFEPCQYREVSG